jgi:hypothetical protein
VLCCAVLSVCHHKQTGTALPAMCHRTVLYRGADKSLARPGRKQATATEDFGFHI